MKKFTLVSVLFSVLFLSRLFASADIPAGYQYLFPQPGAKYVHPSSTIILRFKNISPYKVQNLSGMFTVSGEKSGQHFGKTIIASDKRTIIFKSARDFEPGETIRVNIEPRFNVTFEKTLLPFLYEFSVLAEQATPSPFPAEEERVAPAKKTNNIKNQPMIMSNGVSVPSDFPHVNITQKTNPSSEYIFLNNVGPPNYNIIFNTSGDPVWYWKTPDRRRDFKVQANGWITMLIRDGYGGSGEGFIALTQNFEFIKVMRATNGYSTDEHELYMLPDSGYLLLGRRETTVDMSQYVPGGQTDATVRETCIQEFTADDHMIFIWRAWDHFDIRDMELESLTSGYIRFPHMNALFIDDDDNILLSSRHLSEISKINRQTGEFIWRLCGIPGSLNNDFQFVNDPLNGFRNEHAIRSLGNGHYLLFDNGNMHSPPQSRAVEYAIDTTQMTASLVWEQRNDVPNKYSYYMGNAERLQNGNTHINWAVGDVLPIAQEVTPQGEKVFEMRFINGYHCYRSFRYPWAGNVSKPYLILEPRPDNLTLLFNKFGDHTVKYYNIYGDTSPNPTTLIDTSRFTLKRLTNLDNGVRYYFRVTAISNAGVESDFSNEEDVVVNIVPPGSNLIVNGDFSNGLDSWIWQLQGSGAANVQIEDGVCHLVIQNPGTQIYDVQLRQIGVPLIQGQNYLFEFDAWAEAARIAEIKVGQDASPFTNYSRIGYSALATTSNHFTYSFQMQEPTDTSVRLVINAGAYSPGIYIDNLSLKMKAPTSLEEKIPVLNQFELYTNYPNPFNPVTHIKYNLPERSRVSLIVYNLQGQEVEVLQNTRVDVGLHTVKLDASQLASGIYFYNLIARPVSGSHVFNETKKMILLK